MRVGEALAVSLASGRVAMGIWRTEVHGALYTNA